MPKVSVVIPTYNHEKYVRECIQSTLDQTYQDFEIIITDDGSTDGTVNVIKEFDDSRIQLYTYPENKGACTATNNCIRKAAGEYIAVQNSDDAWESTKLEKQVQYLDSHPEIGAVFTKVVLVDEAGNLIGPEDYKNFYIFEKENRSRYEWLNLFFSSGNCLCHPSVLIRKKCYDEVGLYDERMANIPDQDMWTRLCFKYDIHILNEKLVRFRILADKSSASADKPSTQIRSAFEYIHILNHYLAINDRKIFLKIFPEAEKYGVVEEEYIPYFLSRIALDINTRIWVLWGLQTLFDFLGQDGMAISLEKKYGFRYRDFYDLAAQHDIFNIIVTREKVAQINKLKMSLRDKESQIRRLESQIRRLEYQVHRLESQIQQIQHSIPMRLADRYQRRVERLLRPGTRRRHYYELALSGIRVILTKGWKSFFRKTWKHLTRSLPSPSKLVYALKCLRAACRSPHDNRKGGAITVLYSPFSYDNPEPGMIVNSLEKNGVSVHVAKTHNLFSLIKSIEEQGKPHVIHLHWVHFFILGKSRIKTIIKSISFLSELLILKLCGIKLVWTIHNIVSHESTYPRWELFINRLIARLCNELIVHANSTKLEVRSKYKLSNSKSISIVYPLNYASSYENTMSQSEARKILTLKPRDFVFLYFGLVRAYKGVNELIDYFNQLETSGEINNIKLLIVGKPLNEKIHDNVLSRCAINRNIMPVLKWVDDKEIQIYMNAANIAVFPFENILNSGSVVLAMSFRKPVIAPAMGSIPEILNSKGGFTYRASEKGGLLEAMMRALKCKPDELKAMGDRNFEKVKEFTPETLAARTLEIYRRCLRAQK